MVDYEVDWRELAARDPAADLLDIFPVGPARVDLDLPIDAPVKSLNVDEACVDEHPPGLEPSSEPRDLQRAVLAAS